MSVDQYQRTVNSLDKEIASLEKKKAVADKKAASEAKKAAGVLISKNASAATVKSKMRQIDGYNASSQKAEAEMLICRKRLLINGPSEMMHIKSSKKNRNGRRKKNSNP